MRHHSKTHSLNRIGDLNRGVVIFAGGRSPRDLSWGEQRDQQGPRPWGDGSPPGGASMCERRFISPMRQHCLRQAKNSKWHPAKTLPLSLQGGGVFMARVNWELDRQVYLLAKELESVSPGTLDDYDAYTSTFPLTIPTRSLTSFA